MLKIPGKLTGQFQCPHIPVRYCYLLAQRVQKVEAANALVCLYLQTIFQSSIPSIPSSLPYLDLKKLQHLCLTYFAIVMC